MDDLTDFLKELRNQVAIRAESGSDFSERAFLDIVSEQLEEVGLLDDFEAAHYLHPTLKLRIDGHAWTVLDHTLTLCVLCYSSSSSPETFRSTEVYKHISKLQNFCRRSIEGGFLNQLEESSEGYSAASFIQEHIEKAHRIRLLLITDHPLSDLIRSFRTDSISNLPTFLDVWDLKRIKELSESGADTEPFEIDFQEMCGGLPALPAYVGTTDIENYLVVMPGSILNTIYGTHGQRLLESNVRTFLDFRGKVNNGMRKTLLQEPDKFFSYNNGLTVTATGIETEVNERGLIITKLENMQIVNGGQTTAAIYFSPREKNFGGIDLSKIFVQMKLSVIAEGIVTEVVDIEESSSMKAMIAKYANTQNKVDSADLVSNHSFHLRLEKLSRKILAPPRQSDHKQSKWFYERARGQYATVLRAKTPAQKNRFKMESPPSQKFTKTDFAKFENTWRMHPDQVSKGAQANLKLLGPVICSEFDDNENAFREPFFKDIISKMIVFKTTEKIISRSDWYKESPGYRANLVTYTIAWLRHLSQKKNSDINLELIWKRQSISTSLEVELSRLAYHVREFLTDPLLRINPGGKHVANISEWCKQATCWHSLKQVNMDLQPIVREDLICGSELKDKVIEQAQIGEVSEQLEDMEIILDISPDEWLRLASWYRRKGYPESSPHVRLSTRSASMQILSKSESKSLLKLREDALNNGFFI